MDVREVFEIQQTANYIVTRGVSRVCLQFPDSLLPHAVSIHDALRDECGALISDREAASNEDSGKKGFTEITAGSPGKANAGQASLAGSTNQEGPGLQGFREGQDSQRAVDLGGVGSGPHQPPQIVAGDAADPPLRDLPRFYVLADAATATCSSCCVDEVSPCHVSADCVVHYGHACMSRRPARFPVRYVLPRQKIDVAACASAIKEYFRSSSSTLPAARAASSADASANPPQRESPRVVLVLFALEFAHAAEELARALGCAGASGGAGGGAGGEAGEKEGEKVRYVVAEAWEREVEPEEGGTPAGAATCHSVSGGCCGNGGGASGRSTCGEAMGRSACTGGSCPAAQSASAQSADAQSAAAQSTPAQCAAPGSVFEHGGLRWVLPPGAGMAPVRDSGGSKAEREADGEEAAAAAASAGDAAAAGATAGAAAGGGPAAAVAVTVVWVGSSDDSPSLIALALEHNQTPIFRLDPNDLSAVADAAADAAAASATATAAAPAFPSGVIPSLFHPVDHSRLLRRRYYLVEKAKDASIVGIVIISQAAGAAAASSRATVDRLRTSAKKAGKRAYVIAIRRRVTPEKLANFPECDVIVMVACAEGVLVDSREFYAPVITPFEALMAFEEGREWTGEYRMLADAMVGEGEGGRDGEVKDGGAGKDGEDGEDRGEGEDVAPRFSFVKGSLISQAPRKPTSLSAAGGAGAGASAAAAASSVSSALAVRQDMALSAVPVSSEAVTMARASGQSGYATSAVVEARSGSEFLALRRDYKGLEVPWFLVPDKQEGDAGGGEGSGDGEKGAFMPRVAEEIEAVRVVEGREGRATGYVGEAAK